MEKVCGTSRVEITSVNCWWLDDELCAAVQRFQESRNKAALKSQRLDDEAQEALDRWENFFD